MQTEKGREVVGCVGSIGDGEDGWSIAFVGVEIGLLPEMRKIKLSLFSPGFSFVFLFFPLRFFSLSGFFSPPVFFPGRRTWWLL